MLELIPIVLAAAVLPASGVPGDTCADPIEIEEGITFFDTTTHSDSGYDLYSQCSLMGDLVRDIWFSYHAKTEGVITLSTCDPDSFDTSMIAYQSFDADCTDLEYLACSGDAPGDPECQDYHSLLQFQAQAGCDYLVRVGGWVEGSYGTGRLTLSNNEQSIPQYCPSDINKDRSTNVDDLLSVIQDWGDCSGCSADITGDDVVGVDDLLMIIAAWGQCP